MKTNYVKATIDKMQQNSKYRFCDDREKAIKNDLTIAFTNNYLAEIYVEIHMYVYHGSQSYLL